MSPFKVTVRTSTSWFSYDAISTSSAEAFRDAAEAQGDTPCGITVTPAGAAQ
jgi:hypothetical protein